MKRCPARQSQYPCSAQQPPLTEAGEAREESYYCNRPRPGRRTRENGNCGPTRKPPNYPTWSAQRRSRTATKSRRKEARSKVPFAQSPALSDLVRYVHGYTTPESSEEKGHLAARKKQNFSKMPANPNKVRSRAAKRRPGKKINAHEGMPKNQSRRKVPPSENECTMKPNVAKAKDFKMSRKRPTF